MDPRPSSLGLRPSALRLRVSSMVDLGRAVAGGLSGNKWVGKLRKGAEGVRVQSGSSRA